MPLPITDTSEMMPLALPRRLVGNSSGPYTPRAGTVAAPRTAAAADQSQICGPLVRYITAVRPAPKVSADRPDQPPAPDVGQLAADHAHRSRPGCSCRA